MPRKMKLTPIEGMPPDLLAPPKGCPFAPRCAWVLDKCWEENPLLEPAARDHHVACWVDVTKSSPHNEDHRV